MLLNVLVELGAAVLPRYVSLAAAALRSGIRSLGGLPSKISQLLLSLSIKISDPAQVSIKLKKKLKKFRLVD